jgi:hypothetical protein
MNRVPSTVAVDHEADLAHVRYHGKLTFRVAQSMPLPKPPDDSGDGDATPKPLRASAAKRRSPDDGPLTPTAANRRTSAGQQTPRSAPAAAGRPKTTAKKGEPPTLLNDFFLGRPSAARVAAVKGRRKSVDVARDAARREMQEGVVRKLQQPGGVKDRVKAWQKANAAAVVQGDPDDAASEPTEIWAKEDVESVTEEDRVRIKFRKNAKESRKSRGSSDASKENEILGQKEKMKEEEVVPDDPRLRGPPKKRIVSDNNWMKRRIANANNGASSPANPPVNRKVEEWAKQVQSPAKAPGPLRQERERRSTAKSTDSQPPDEEDGIRVKPIAIEQPSSPRQPARPPPGKRKDALADDGIRVEPLASRVDDGIRVRPIADSQTPKTPETKGPDTGSSRPVRRSDESVLPQTPTRTKADEDRRKRRGLSASHLSDQRTAATSSDEGSSCSGSSATSRAKSGRGSIAAAKSLASIPFGHSAFSELDLPVGADAHNTKRPKAQRNNSFKAAVPNVFKKVVSEGKKIIQEKVDQPKPMVNKPPSIESWLHNTVDPFVESPTPPKRKSVEKEWERESRKRSSTDIRPADAEEAGQATGIGDSSREADDDRGEEDLDKTPTRKSPDTVSSAGLRRSRATRATASPMKSGGRKAFRDALKSAFKGESAGARLPSMTYQSKGPAREEEDGDYDRRQEEQQQQQQQQPQQRRRSSGPTKRSPSPEPVVTEVRHEEEVPPAPPFKRRPPTNGFHELSTIASEESSSTHGSDVASTLSRTTMTQTTSDRARPSELSGQQKSQKSGVKRRLTRHSDLVSVLSLPDDGHLPQRRGTVKQSDGLHRKTSKIGRATMGDLLDEFQADEDLYLRELKTLVDGVIPVLLTQAVNSSARASDLFSSTSEGEGEGEGRGAEAMGKAVVNMGIALEKLRNHHRRTPPLETSRLLAWLEGLHPVYDNYLDVWRLWFQGVVVNLAPAADKPEDEDSLLNAMPRNEKGDVLDVDGQRVDVAYLLKRPLVRLKWLLKFIRVRCPFQKGRGSFDLRNALF